jgi:hypothetical protein
MGLKHLKEQNKGMQLNIVDILSKFDPTKTKKLTPLLLKVFKKIIKSKGDEIWCSKDRNPNCYEVLTNMDVIEREFSVWLIEHYLFYDNIERLTMFAEYLDRGLIEKNDISTYESMDEILNEIGKASLKDVLKNSKKDILIVHQDDEWLCFKPLTHDSSIAYGHGSKWCTAMKFEPEYFYRHSVEGILIYAINKVNGRKYGFYGNKYQKLSVWEDTGGQVDSLLTNMPQELLFKLKDLIDFDKYKTNYEHFSETEKKNCDKYIRRYNDLSVEINNPVEQDLRFEQNQIEDIELPMPRLMPTFPPVNERVDDRIRLTRPSYFIGDDLP